MLINTFHVIRFDVYTYKTIVRHDFNVVEQSICIFSTTPGTLRVHRLSAIISNYV